MTVTVSCAKHGIQEKILVCNHTRASMNDGLPRGLYMWRDEDGVVCAWCGGCHARAAASETGEKREPLQFDVMVLCAGCFAPIQQMNGGGQWGK